MFFGLSEVRLGVLSPCLWNLPAGGALSSVLELEGRLQDLALDRDTASHQPGPPSQNLSACSVPTLTPQPEMWVTAWDPADTAQGT